MWTIPDSDCLLVMDIKHFKKKTIFLGCGHPFLLASMGLGFVFIVAVIAILACLIATRIRIWFRRRPSQTQSHAFGHSGRSRPHAGPQHSVVYYAPGHQLAGVSLDRQMLRGQNQPPLSFDEDRFTTTFPESTTPMAPETPTVAPAAVPPAAVPPSGVTNQTII
jgi:hypothetical protein